MDMLQKAVTYAADGWSDYVSESINVNHVNAIIKVCNEMNSGVQYEGKEIEDLLVQLRNLLDSIR